MIFMECCLFKCKQLFFDNQFMHAKRVKLHYNTSWLHVIKTQTKKKYMNMYTGLVSAES